MTLGYDKTYVKEDGIGVIYLAGGCFWGLEKLMQSIPGVVRGTSGYANGSSDGVPTYSQVCTGKTGYRETVRVEYKEKDISLDAILFAYFHVIDVTVKDRQGNDRGTQYQTGIYYTDDKSQKIIEQIVSIEKERHPIFEVEVAPLDNFYDAEEYHQDYLDKNPNGYCHITPKEMNEVTKIFIDPANYRRPKMGVIEEKLTPQQFNVTQKSSTEPPFVNQFWKNHEAGIYVDVVTGEPMFSSKDKYDSSCGWPSFSKSLDDNALVYLKDRSAGMIRTEVKSRAGNSHLGHVFYGDYESPNGTRYCINSASLRFVPYDHMEDEGYGYLKEHVK